jgi:peptidoglycan/LPS O-acetylase OafA/YrhL
MALLYTGSNDTRLYYGTDTHAQCILTGAALAAVLALVSRARRERGTMPGPRRIAHLVIGGDPAWAATSRNLRIALSLLGVAGLAVTAFLWMHVQGDAWWLYHGGFMVAALSTGCVLTSAVCVQRGVVAQLLGLRPLRFVGRISYGMYLWHFPLFVWMSRERTGLHGWALFGARVLVTVVVATASFYLVEQPIRQGTLMRGRRSLALVPAAIAGVATVMVLATVPLGGGSALALGSKSPSTPVAQGTQNVLLVGDSMAETLGNGIEGKVGNFFGLNIINDGVPDCSLAMGSFDVQAWPPHISAPPCQAGSGDPGWPADWANMVTRYTPKVSIFLGRLDIVNRQFNGEWTHIGDPAYDQYLLGQIRLAVRVLTAHGGKVVLMTTPYYSTGEQPNGQPWPEDNPVRVNQFNSMLRQVAAENPGRAVLFDLNKLVDPSGRFQSDVDGVDVRFIDGIHWTYQGDCWLAPRVLPAIRQLADGIDATSPAVMATLVKQAEASFPTSLCHAPT